MNLRAFIKSIKLGFALTKESLTIFFASVGLVALGALFLWSSIFLSYFLNQTLDYLKGKINFSIYFTQDVNREDVLSLQKILQEFPKVENVFLVPKEEALESLKKSVGYSSVLRKAIEVIKTNPLSDYLVVTADEPEVYQEIADYLMQSKFKPKIEFLTYFENQKAIQKLINLTKVAKISIYLLIISVLVLTIILLFHLSTLVIFSQKESIEIFKLLGASPRFIRIPFYVLAFLVSFVGSIIALLLVILFLKLSENLWLYIFPSLLPQDFIRFHFWPLNLFVFGVILFISLLAVRFSLRKYLKD